MPQASVMACTMMFIDAVPDTTAVKPGLKNNLATASNTPPAVLQDTQHVDNTNTNTGRTKTASESYGQNKQRANH